MTQHRLWTYMVSVVVVWSRDYGLILGRLIGIGLEVIALPQLCRRMEGKGGFFAYKTDARRHNCVRRMRGI
jgi:hypothetical protein